jgi:hypothetical protein
MKIRFEVTNQSQLSCAVVPIIWTLILIIAAAFLVQSLISVILIIAVLFIGIIPTIILHSQYYNQNRGMKIEIDKNTRIITVLYNERSDSISFDKIKSIMIVKNVSIESPWSGYHYALVTTSEGKQIIVTCLIIKKLKEYFDELGLPTNIEKAYFPSIPKEFIISAA